MALEGGGFDGCAFGGMEAAVLREGLAEGEAATLIWRRSRRCFLVRGGEGENGRQTAKRRRRNRRKDENNGQIRGMKVQGQGQELDHVDDGLLRQMTRVRLVLIS